MPDVVSVVICIQTARLLLMVGIRVILEVVVVVAVVAAIVEAQAGHHVQMEHITTKFKMCAYKDIVAMAIVHNMKNILAHEIAQAHLTVIPVEMDRAIKMSNLILDVRWTVVTAAMDRVISTKNLIARKTVLMMAAVAHQIHLIVLQNFQIVMIQDLILVAVRVAENILIHKI